MTEHDSEHFARLREEEAEAARAGALAEGESPEVGEPADAAESPVSEAAGRGLEQGNDTSKMRLIHSEIDEILAEKDAHAPDPEIQQALHDLREIPVREALEEADSE